MRRLECGVDVDVGGVGRPYDLRQCSDLLMSSLSFNNIGAAGAQDLGAALRINTTLTKLM